MSISRIVATLFVGFLALGAISPAHAIFDAFLKVEGVPGEVTTDLPQPPPPSKIAAPPGRQNSATVVRNFTITRKLELAPSPAKLRAK